MKLKKFMLPILLGGLLLNQSTTSAEEVDPLSRNDGLTVDEVLEASEDRDGDPISFAAHARYRFEYTEDVKEDQRLAYNLYLTSTFKNDFKFLARIGNDARSSAGDDNAYDPKIQWAMLVGEIGHGTQIRLGRQDLSVGYGLGIYDNRQWDGASAKIELGNEDSALRFGALQKDDNDFYFAAYDGQFGDNLGIRASYTHNKDIAKLGTIGAQYKFNSPITLTGEYGRNQKTKANGYFVQGNYGTADLDEERSWTTWLQYRNSDAVFNGATRLDYTLKSIGFGAAKSNGFELGFSYVPVEDMLATIKLWNGKISGADRETSGAIQLEYFWK